MSPTTVRIAVAFHSGNGHTARQARAIADAATAVPDTIVELIDVGAMTDETWAALEQADAIVFGAPTYMGGPSGAFKTFADASAAAWAERKWAGKLAAGFTSSAHMSGDKLNTLIYFALLAAQHGMTWVNLDMKGGWGTSESSPDELNRLGSWIGAMAQVNMDQGPELAPPASDLATAAELGRRVARVAHQLARGRLALAEARWAA